jgi:hypothetical protein
LHLKLLLVLHRYEAFPDRRWLGGRIFRIEGDRAGFISLVVPYTAEARAPGRPTAIAARGCAVSGD